MYNGLLLLGHTVQFYANKHLVLKLDCETWFIGNKRMIPSLWHKMNLVIKSERIEITESGNQLSLTAVTL